MVDQPIKNETESKVLPRMFVLMDRENKRTPFQHFIIHSYSKFIEWLDINSFPFLILGVFLNTYFLVNEPSTLNIIFECLYVIVFGYKTIQMLRRRKQTGTVVDASTGQPLDIATIRVASGDRFVQVRITDNSGLFFILLQPGNYTVFCSRRGYETTSKKIFVPKAKKVKVVKLDFSLRKATI
ncbi:MAG: carboxypeptidase-like regulatory domain-containing protein [bacterium]|nr:carboxypeptidase-like regulatory domain-containing protein [bacterium]